MSRLTLRTVVPKALGTVLAGVVAAALVVSSTLTSLSPADPDYELAAGGRVTPGNFTGFGFDQCEAPSQRAMTTWLSRSPFLAVGIYISGDSRGCRGQKNLTPKWVDTQLKHGWRLLPITLGPQASCNPHFPRYGNDERINPRPGAGRYPAARAQGRAEAAKAVRAAKRLGIGRQSVLYYDLEAFNISQTRCRESALWFLSAWTTKLNSLGYKSGVYSSAASGIKALDDARVKRPRRFDLPDQIWIADWNGKANTRSIYVRNGGWQPHKRIKQYQGGHDERWGGVRINIDRNFLDVGRGTIAPGVYHCGNRKNYVPVSRTNYIPLERGQKHAQVRILKCLLKERGSYRGKIDRVFGPGLANAIKQYKGSRGWPRDPQWRRSAWVSLLATGSQRVVKRGSGGESVRNLQRALNAAKPGLDLTMVGKFDAATDRALRSYQRRNKLPVVGVANPITWKQLKRGNR